MEDKVTSAIRACYQAALFSPDPSTQNAAVLMHPNGQLEMDTLAINRFPRNVTVSDERWERPIKYAYVEHAERNSIYAAARQGIQTNGLVMVCPWAACADCARAIIQAGVICLIRRPHDSEATHSDWNETTAIADEMLAEAGVRVLEHTEALEGLLPVRRNGFPMQP